MIDPTFLELGYPMVGPTFCYKGIVLRIIDGDTIVVQVDLGFSIKSQQKLRLARINTPELTANDQETRDKAVRAKAFTETALILREVVITTNKTDIFGRYIAEVFYQDHPIKPQKNLSDELIKAGHAVPYKG